MFLYTIIPLEYIFGEDEDCNEPSREKSKEVEVKKGQASILCQLSSSGEMKINRVISSNPQDYLNPEWQPGAILQR